MNRVPPHSIAEADGSRASVVLFMYLDIIYKAYYRGRPDRLGCIEGAESLTRETAPSHKVGKTHGTRIEGFVRDILATALSLNLWQQIKL